MTTQLMMAEVEAKLEAMRGEMEAAHVRLGFIGESGSGKSSLVNAIVGRQVFEVGATRETTLEPQEVDVDGLTLVDLPGCGTTRFPARRYVEQFRLQDHYDAFVLVTANRVKEPDVLLFKELHRAAGKPLFVVRSHFDQVVEERGEGEGRLVCESYVRDTLRAGPGFPVYLVCSVKAETYDLERLILAIRSSLPDWKQHRFTRAARAYGEETLARKRDAVHWIVGVYAGLAGLNGLNPVPGLNVGVDLALLSRMAGEVISTYGLDEAHIRYLESRAWKRAAVSKGLHELSRRFGRYLMERFLESCLVRLGKQAAVRNAVTWVPFIGPLANAGLGVVLTYRLGEDLIDQAEAGAREAVALFASQGADS